jgi:hypothetical protein
MMARRMWRRGSLAWQAVSYAAFLAMSLFVTFDLLDLDGSQTQSRLMARGVTAARSAVDTECLPVQDPTRLDPISLDIPSQILRVIDSSSKTLGRLQPTPTTTRFARVRRPLQLRHANTSANPASEDPA